MCHCIFFGINPRVSKHHAFRLHRATGTALATMYDNDVILAEKQVSLQDNLNRKKNRQVIYYVVHAKQADGGSKLWSVKFHHAGTSLKCTPYPEGILIEYAMVNTYKYVYLTSTVPHIY